MLLSLSLTVSLASQVFQVSLVVLQLLEMLEMDCLVIQ